MGLALECSGSAGKEIREYQERLMNGYQPNEEMLQVYVLPATIGLASRTLMWQ
jgi:hypothetical protein